MRSRLATAAFAAAILISCGSHDAVPVQDTGGGRDVSRFTLTSLRGTRDGDRLAVKIAYGDGSNTLHVDLQIRVGSPTQLQSGTWSGFNSGGSVQERSLTFLGGQSGPPSLGGRFDLLSASGAPQYRIAIPLQELKDRL